MAAKPMALPSSAGPAAKISCKRPAMSPPPRTRSISATPKGQAPSSSTARTCGADRLCFRAERRLDSFMFMICSHTWDMSQVGMDALRDMRPQSLRASACSCEDRNPGRRGAIPPWAPAFAGAQTGLSARIITRRFRPSACDHPHRPNQARRRRGRFPCPCHRTAPSSAMCRCCSGSRDCCRDPDCA